MGPYHLFGPLHFLPRAAQLFTCALAHGPGVAATVFGASACCLGLDAIVWDP
jgi:hypothetical protein